MAIVLVNQKNKVKGRVTVTQQLDISTEPNTLSIMGQFATHTYFKEITSLKTERFTIADITIIQESLGSEDFDIVYSFIANRLDVEEVSNLSKEEIEEIEAEIYGGEK